MLVPLIAIMYVDSKPEQHFSIKDTDAIKRHRPEEGTVFRLSKKIIAVIAMTMLVFGGIASGAWAKSYPNIVLFGDSLSDHGNMNALVPAAPETWTNGDVWIDYLATKWEVTDENLDNNAFGGAMTSGNVQDPTGSNPTITGTGFTQQVNTYVASKPVVTPDDTLFILWIGGNDLLAYFKRLSAGDPTLPSSEDYVKAAVTRVADAMGALATVGAKNFLILNLPNLGTTPQFIPLGEATQSKVTQLTAAYNVGLLEAADSAIKALEFKAELGGQDIKYTLSYYDVFTYLTKVVASGVFPNTTGTYLVLDANGNPTGGVNEPAEDYLFWDLIHPTTKAHGMLADEINRYMTEEDPGVDASSSSDTQFLTCFIESARTGSQPFVPVLVLFGVAGLALCLWFRPGKSS